MTISVETNNGTSIVHIEGDMTIYNAVGIRNKLLDLLRGCMEMELNLSGVTDMDTAGFQLLLLAKREALNTGKTLRLVEHSPATLEVIDLYGTLRYFDRPAVFSQAAC